MCYDTRQKPKKYSHFVRKATKMKLLHQSSQALRLRYQQQLDYPIHLHNALELVLLTEGQTTVLYGNKRLTLQAGELFVAFPGSVHGYESSQNTQAYVLIAPAVPWLEAYRDTFEEKRPASPIVPAQVWQPAGIGQLLAQAIGDKDTADPRVLQGYLLVLVGKLLPLLTLTDAGSSDTDGIRELLLFLHDHYTEPLSRQEIAKAIGYNESYVSHLCSAALGTTLTNYITALRLEDARRLLTSTRQSISAIAVQLGFGSIRSFNRIFLQQTGMTPTQYRNTAKPIKTP